MKIGKLKRRLAALSLLVLVLVSAAFIVPRLFDLNQYRGLIISAVENATQGEVKIGHITWGISRGIWLKTDKFSITEAPGFPVDLNLTHIYAKFAVLPLLSRRIEIQELTLDGPGAVLKIEPETDETGMSHDKPEDRGNEALGGVFPFDISVKKLSIQNGRIRIENGLVLPGQEVVHTFNAVKIDIRDIRPGKEIIFQLSLEGEGATGLASLKAQGSFKGLTETFIIKDPEIKLNILLSSLNTEIFKPYLKKSSPGEKLGGHVSLEMNYEGDFFSHYSVEGSVNLTGIRYQDPSLGENVLSGVETIISCQAAVDPNNISIRDLNISIGNSRVNGTVLIKNWHEQPVMQDILLSSTLSPGELVPLIPWKHLGEIANKIRPVLEAGGKVEIEKLTMGRISLTEPFPDPAEFLSMGLTAKVSDISIPPMSDMPELKLVSGNLSLDHGVANIDNLQIRVAAANSSILIEGLNARVIINPDRIKISDFSAGVFIPKTTETQSGQFSMKLTGSLENWQKEPVVLIQSLSTSSIPLGPVVSIVPWEQMGDKADSVKKVLLAGGSLKVNSCSLPGINLKKPPKDIKTVISKTTAAISLSDIEIQPRPSLPPFDGISGNIALDKGVLNISDAQGRMGPVTFPSIQLRATGFNDNLAVTASLKGPVKVMETENKAIETFLMEKGFKRFAGAAEIDMNFKYIQQQPEDWVAKGSLILDGLNAETHPKGVSLSNVKGKLFFSRAKTTEVTVEELSGKINAAPVKLAGKLINGRTPDMVLSGKAYTNNLDLAEFNSLLPFLDYLKLVGKLDLDLDFKIPFANPADTQIEGTLDVSRMGFHLPDSNRVVRDTDIQMGFAGDSAQLTKMDININDQLFHIEGKAFDPAAPKINLLVHASDLDVDRLLAGDRPLAGDKKMAEPSLKQDSDISDKALPPWAHNLTADLRVALEKGKYSDQPFTDFKVGTHYEKGIFQTYDVAFSLAKGKIITTGSADLRNLKKIRFTMTPDVTNVRIGELSPLFKVEKMPLDGPLSITGRLEGEAGNSEVLLSSLKGILKADVGAGQMADGKHLGKISTKILSFINLRGLFSGALINKMENEGIPFTAITSETTFSNGNMNLNKYIFTSDALNGIGQGIINFPDNKIALQVVLEPLQRVNKILGVVPILGKQAQKLTGVHLIVEGTLDDPKVSTVLTKGVTDTVKGTLGIPGAFFKDTEKLSDEIDAYVEEKEGGDNNKKN